MNTTTTHRRFAVKRLLPCLALLVASVSSCVPLNTYSGPPFTPAAVTYNSIDTPADRSAYITRVLNACKLGSEGYLLESAQALHKCVTDVLLTWASGKVDKDLWKNGKELESLMYESLAEAEEQGANRTAVGRVYYDHARTYLTCSSTLRAQGYVDLATMAHNDAIRIMRRARAKGIAEAAAYLRTH